MEHDENSFEHLWRTEHYGNSSLSRFPHLRLHDLEESRAWSMKSKEEFEKRGEDYLEEDGVWGNPRLYVPLRFFESLIKFHEGSLDLSGRHALVSLAVVRPQWLPHYLKRYTRLVEMWKFLYVDYQTLYTQSTPFTYIEPDFRGKPTEYQDYKFKDETLWPGFARKWRICKWWDCSTVFSYINKVVEAFGKHPKPVLQQFCLYHLPAELTSHIFHFAGLEDARLLSSTCHRFRSIGLKNIFWMRRLTLLEKFDGNRRATYSDEQMHKVFLKARESLLSTIDFLISREDLINALEKLMLTDGIKQPYAVPRSFVQYLNTAGEMADFYVPIQRGFESVLMAANCLSELRFFFIVITPTVVHSIASMPALHTVSLHICSISADLAEIAVAGQSPKVTTVRNLSVYMHIEEENEEISSTWFLIPLFTGLHNVSIKSSENVALPPDILFDRLCHFQDVERFMLNHCPSQDTPLLTQWISNSTQLLGYIPLTHFKLHSPWPMDDLELFELIAILQHAPSLQALSIDGILYAEPDLLERIAEAVPKLLSLWLVKRHNDRQHHAKSCPWPQAHYHYAEKLRLFPSLLHFGWNDTMPRLVPSTSVMLNFEEDFPDPDSLEYWERGHQVESYFMDGYLTSALFALHSPTLEAVCWLDDRSEKIDFITRNSNGTMDLEAARKFPAYERSSELLRNWNPSILEGNWPRTVPRGKSENW